MSNTADDRCSDSIGANRIVVFPDSYLSTFCQNGEETLSEAISLDFREVFIAPGPCLRYDKVPQRFIQELVARIAKNFQGCLVYGQKNSLEVMRTD